MELYTNSVKARLKRKEKVSAAWLQLGSNVTAEIFANAGFDVLVIDVEHSPVNMESVLSMCQAANGSDSVLFARLPWNDLSMIKRLSDCGVHGMHVPYVSTYEEALNAVHYSKYAPIGVRGIAGSPRAAGYGLNRGNYHQRANDENIVMIALETPEAVDNLPEIMTIKEIDGIFIGPMDLSTSMGIMGQFDHPDFKEMIKRIEDIVIPSDKFLATVGAGFEGAQVLYDKGYNLVYMMSDSVDLAKISQKMVQQFKEANL